MAFPETGSARGTQLTPVEIREHREKMHENFRKIATHGVGSKEGAFAGQPRIDIGFEVEKARLAP